MADTNSEAFLRLGSHSEKQYILKMGKLFSGVIIGANLLESTPGATVSLCLNVQGASKRQLAIDPMTYTFGMDLDYIKSVTLDRSSAKKGATKTGLKKSFVKMVNQFGEPLKTVVLKDDRPVAPADFNDKNIPAFCKAISDYQLSRMQEHFDTDSQLQEVAEYAPSPSFTFAPYFFIPYVDYGKSWQSWKTLNLKLAEAYSVLPGEVPKHGIICVSEGILDSAQESQALAADYSNTGLKNIWLWFSNLREDKSTALRLKNLIAITQVLTQAGVTVFNLHGGYFSAALSKIGMKGFSHGVGYGESKDVVPVVGVTVPTVNYHYPPLHIRVSIYDIESALAELEIETAAAFHARVCDCTICKGVLAGDLKNVGQLGEFILKSGNTKESQTAESAKKCRFHFLLARRKELDFVNSTDLQGIKVQLKSAYEQHFSLPPYLALQNKAKHLSLWLSVL